MADLTHPEAERAVLAALLLDGRLWRTGQLGDLAADDFGDARNAAVYRAMAAVDSEGEPIDIRTAQAELERRGELEAAGGVAYLAGLDVDLPDLGRLESYARIVREAAIRRRLTDSLKKSVQRLSTGAPFGEVVSEANAALRKADERIAVERLAPIGECLDDVLRSMDHPSPTGLVGIPTGYPELDRYTLGWQGGQLVVIAGRPGQGKTALACCMARAAVDFGHPTLFASLEMGREELAARLVSAETGISFAAIRSGHMSRDQRGKVEQAVRELSRLPILLIDSPYLTPSRFSALVRRAKYEAGVKIAFVDYLGLMAPDDRHETRNLEIAALSRSLKLLAKEAGLPIVALHQLNRAPEKRASPRPVLSDLRDSGAIEQDADTVILIYQDADKVDSGEAELIVAKQRNGMTGPVRVRSVLSAFRFDPWSSTPAQSGLSFGGG